MFCRVVAVSSWMGIMLAAGIARGATPIGAAVDDFHLPDPQGREQALATLADGKPTVVAFLGAQCPIAKLYAARLEKLSADYGDRVAFVAVMSNKQDSLEDIRAFVAQHELTFAVLKDQRNKVADTFGAERTPTVYLLDGERKVRYFGRVDDQYGVGVVRKAPEREDLKLAIDEVLAGMPVATPMTKAAGCLIGREREATGDRSATYARDVAPILQRRCVECHRAGEIGPFELTSYEDAAGWGEMIAEVLRDRRMPPWHASPEHGSFANDRSMPEAEKEVIAKWVANGCPAGDPADAPPPREFTVGWQLPRDPDVVLAMEKPFDVPADAGRDGVPYQYFVVPTGFTEDKWIEGAEVQPGNRAVVHHVIVYASPPEVRRRRRDWIFLSAYVPGLRYDGLPAGSAKRVPAGYVLVFEMHYTPNGSPQQDVTKIGLTLADVDQITGEVVTTEIGNVAFSIPPGDAHHVVTATSQPIENDVTLLSLSPHMHLRGKAFRYELVTPDGRREVLLDVPAYDFNWQTRYVLSEPRPLPKGSLIFCRAVFDNSADNLANPDPSATVRWGDQSWNEMMLGYFDVLTPRDDARRAGTKMVRTGLDLVAIFDSANGDGDDGLSAEEASGYSQLANNFAAIDSSGDERLQLGEIIAAMRALGRGR